MNSLSRLGITLFLVCIIFLSSALSLPTPPLSGCPSIECPGTNDVYSYEPQKTYTYKIESTSEHILKGASSKDHKGKVSFSAVAELQAISPCQFGLSLTQIQVTGSTKPHGKLPALEGKAIQFGLLDGKLLPEICSDKSDKELSLNLKRAVVSLLQASTTSQTQTDIFGECTVEVSSNRGGEGILMINSHRDLNRCKKREHIVSGIPSSTYIIDSDIQASPVLSSSVKVQQKIKNGILESASSHEEYLFRPFSNQGNGAMVSIYTSMTLQPTKSQFTFQAPQNSKLEGVIFEPIEASSVIRGKKEDLIKAIEAACSTIQTSQGLSKIREVNKMTRTLNSNDLLIVQQNVAGTKAFADQQCAQNIFHDSLFFAGTGEAIETVGQLIKSKTLKDLTTFYTQLAFTRDSTVNAVKAVNNMISGSSIPRELTLGAASFAGHSLTRLGSKVQSDVDQIINKIANPINNCEVNNRAQENKIVLAMKAIHNAHYIPDSVATKLKQCVLKKKASNRIRSAALDAMQGDAANKKLKDAAYTILGDVNEDSELRIKAYLVLATCPCGNVAKFVQDLLRKEPINQVGAFITSHLNNLRASANPEKVSASQYLSSVDIPEDKFNFDLRKYSSNSELSYSLGTINAAASTEANLIFSQNSFIPRYSSLNFTTNLFGHSFNFLEVGVRTENLERILESYLGPKGYFKSNSPNDVLEKGNKTWTQAAGRFKQRFSKSFRSRRSVAQSDLDKMQAKVQLPWAVSDAMSIDLDIKLFGEQLAFWDFSKELISPTKAVDQVFDQVDSLLEKLKNYESTIQKQTQFLEVDLVYPTASGFPLSLKASSQGVISIQLESKIDVQQIIKDPKNMQLAFKLIPSGTMNMEGEIEVDFYAATTGLKHESTVHSSLGIDCTLKLLNGKSFDLDMGTPLKKAEVIFAKSDVFATSSEKGGLQQRAPLQFTATRKDMKGCYDIDQLGLKFCGDFANAVYDPTSKNPHFPLDGPARFILFVEKIDPQLDKYNLRALYNVEDPNMGSFELVFNTPGTSKDREWSLRSEFKRKPNYELSTKVKSPHFNAMLSVKLINDDGKHVAIIHQQFNEMTFDVEVGLEGTGDERKTVYTPILRLSGSTVQEKQITITGTITAERNKPEFKYSFDDLVLKTNSDTYGLEGFVSKNQRAYATDVKVKFNNLADYYHWKMEFEREEKSKRVYLEAHASKYKDFSLAIDYNLQHDKGMLDNKLKIHHGTDLTDETSCLTVNQYFKMDASEDRKEFDLSMKNLVSYPALELNSVFDLEATHKSFHYNLAAGYSDKQISSESSLKFKLPPPEGQKLRTGDLGGYEFDFKGQVAGKSVTVESRRQVLTSDTSKMYTKISLQPKNSFIEINTDVTHKLDKGDYKMKATNVIAFNDHPHQYTLCTGMQSNAHSCEGHVKFAKDEEDLMLLKGEAKHGDTETGKFTILLKDYLDGSGTFEMNKAKTEGNIKAEIIAAKINRKLKLDAALKPGAKTTTKLVTFELLLDADNNPKNKVSLESSIDVLKDGRTFDTKSKLILNEKNFNLMMKGVTPNRIPSENGVLMRFDGNLELPSGQKITGMSEFVRLQNENGFTSKFKFDDGKGSKLNYEGRSSRVLSYDIPAYDGSGKLSLVAPGKKDVTIQMSLTNRQIGYNEKAIDYKVDIGGNVMPAPVKVTTTLELVAQPRYILKASYGDKFSADVSGKMSLNNDKEKWAEIDAEVKTNVKGYEQVKAKHSIHSSKLDNQYKLNSKCYCEINTERQWDNDFDFGWKKEEGHVSGEAKLSMLTGTDTQARILTSTYDYKGSDIWKVALDNAKMLQLSTYLTHADEKVGYSFSLSTPGDGTRSGQIDLEALTNFDKYPKVSIHIDTKIPEDEHQIESTVDIKAGDDRHIRVEGQASFESIKRSYGVTVTKIVPASDHPLLKVFVSFNKPTSTEASGEISFHAGVDNPVSLDASGRLRYPGGFENFDWEGTINSETLKLKDVTVKIDTNPNKAGKSINIVASSPEKTYLEGSASYQKKSDATSDIYEGQGNFKVNGESNSAKFRYTNKALSQNKDGETGFKLNLNAELSGSKGKRTVQIENIVSDKTIRVFDKYCGPEGKCSILEVSNTYKHTDGSEFFIENRVGLDIEEFSKLPPFHLHGKFHAKNMEIEHIIETELGSDATKSQYKYEATLKKRKLSVHFTLPQRTITFDSALIVPEDVGKSRNDNERSYKFETSLALNKKNQPDNVLKLISTMDIKKAADGTTYNSETKLTHPALPKDFSIKSSSLYGGENMLLDSSTTLDIFATKKQAIVITAKSLKTSINGGYNMTYVATLTSKGQNLDFKVVSHAVATKSDFGFGSFATIADGKKVTKFGGLLAGTKENLLVLLQAPTVEIFRFVANCQRAKELKSKATFDFTLLDTIKVHGKAEGFSSFTMEGYNMNDANKKLVYNALFDISKAFSVEGQRVVGEKSDQLFKLLVPLDAKNFLKITHSVNNNAVKGAVEGLQNAGKAAGDKLVALVDDTTKEASSRSKAIIENIKKAQPNFKPLINRLQEEMKAMQQEFTSDPSINEIIEILKSLVAGVSQSVSKIVESITVYVDKMSVIIKDVLTKMSELAAKIGPTVTEASGKVGKALSTVFLGFLEILTNLTSKVVEAIKENSDEIQKYIALCTEFISENSKPLRALMEDAKVFIEELIEAAREQLGTPVSLDKYKELVKDFYDTVLVRYEGTFEEIQDTLMETIPIAEVKSALQAIFEYINKKVKKQDVDDYAEIEKIIQNIVDAIRAVAKQTGIVSLPGLPEYNVQNLLRFIVAPVSFDILGKLPRFTAIRFSLLNILQSGDLPSITDLLATYFVPRRRFSDIVPPYSAYAQVTKSGHFMTFDGDHFTLKGDCEYLLARDFDDANFTLSIKLAGGKVNTLSYYDSNDIVEIKSDGSVIFNGGSLELPYHENELAIYRTLHGVHLKSKNGVWVSCDESLCSFTINGYYFAKTRGLLGTITNEKYDDLELPNGQVATTAHQFANAYKLDDSCANLPETEHKHVKRRDCEQAFSEQSSLSICYPFVKALPYQQACEDEIAEGTSKEDTLQAICEASHAYVKKCRDSTFLQPNLPPNCAQCSTTSDKSIPVGESSIVKAPIGKADVIILVEQVKENEEIYENLVAPLLASLSTDLKTKGISDVNMAMIGFGAPKQFWPALLTTNGKFTYEGVRPKQLTFGVESKQVKSDTTASSKILNFLDRIRDYTALELGHTSLGKAIEQVLKYPFRPDASKTVVLVKASPCKKSPIFLSLQPLQILAIREYFIHTGITNVLIHPVEIVSTDKKIIGFDGENVLSTNKKQVDSSSRSSIDYSQDSCAAFIDLVNPTVFSSKSFKDIIKNTNAKKNFIQAASNRLVTLLASNEVSQTCRCRLRDGLYSETFCSVIATGTKKSKA